LGYAKIYCELPEPIACQGETHIIAGWLGFKFLDIRIKNLRQLSPEEIQSSSIDPGDGILQYKYIPRTGEWGTADISHAVLTPAATPNKVIKEKWKGEGTVEFHKSTWNDLPTMFHIVNAFHDLEIKEYLGASMSRSVGGRDLSDQRILR